MSEIKTFLILGHRRWARLFAEELCSRVKPNTKIYLIGNPRNNELKRWLQNSGLISRIIISKKIVNIDKKKLAVAFVVNSAYMHEFCVKDLLCRGYNVVCEKPISFSRNRTVKLINLAEKKKLNLFCTNTYSFASYLTKLKDGFLKKKYSDIFVTWTDPKKEIRYNQIKGYDSSVPIIYDILPHVANILYIIIGNFKLRLKNLDIKNGGSKVIIHYQQKKINITIRLERNAAKRKRFIKFISKKSQLNFDFTKEPGLIKKNNNSQFKIDRRWSIRSRPISIMINSVICFFELGKKDSRLNLITSLLGNELIDAVAKKYVDNQIKLLKHQKKYSLRSVVYGLKEFNSIKERTLEFINKNSTLYSLVKNKKNKW